MLKNSYKILFFLTMMIGTFMAISSFSWLSIWMGLEMNLLSFIPLMMSSKNLFSSESSLKYFFIQAIASSIFLFSIIIFFLILNLFFFFYYYVLMIILSTMMLKMGMAPFHFWLPSIMEGLEWMKNLILMTWQKIAPLMILSYCLNFYFSIFVIFFSMIFGSLGGLNQTSMRKLMAFSSINHMGWMMAGMMFNEKIWMIYFLFYSLLNISIVILFNNFKMFNINQIFSFFNINQLLKLTLFLVLLSLGGLPPFFGFFPKWMIIELMIFSNLHFILIFMMFFSLITLFFYLRICYSALLLNHLTNKWNFNNFMKVFKKNMILLFFLVFISTFSLIFINMFFYWM